MAMPDRPFCIYKAKVNINAPESALYADSMTLFEKLLRLMIKDLDKN